VSPQARKPIGSYKSMVSREVVYETPDGLEIETRDQYDVARKRVLYEDVLLVTFHREAGIAFLIVTGLFGVFFFGMAAVLVRSGEAGIAAGAFFAIIGLPFLFAFTVRLLFKVDVVTVFGRRSKATMRFSFRKQAARQTYGSICARVRQVHRQLEQQYAAAEPAVPAAETADEPPPLPPPFVE
jgi:hypothetical protein